MAKRKLSKQQKRRLDEKRVQQLSELHTSDSEASTEGEYLPGLVITNFGKRVLIEDPEGTLHTCLVRQHLGKLVAGDQVIWQADIEPLTGVVTALTPRTQELSRPGFRGDKRMVASNIDQLGIVAPIEPGIHPDMIDRYLVAAHQLSLPAFIIINKVDLVTSDEQWETIAEQLWPYDELGIEILPVSTLTGEGLETLEAFLRQKSSVIVGISGAGKSSLIQALIPDIEIKTNVLSDYSGLGQHTTTNSVLYHLPNTATVETSEADKKDTVSTLKSASTLDNILASGALIDTPGVRMFSPQACDLHELERAFPDFSPFIGLCRFNNCTHTQEPGCAIVEAVKEEEIAESRYLSFQRLREEFTQEP